MVPFRAHRRQSDPSAPRRRGGGMIFAMIPIEAGYGRSMTPQERSVAITQAEMIGELYAVTSAVRIQGLWAPVSVRTLEGGGALSDPLARL